MTYESRKKKYRVALVIETSSIYGRRLLEGVTRYIRHNSNWVVLLEQRSLMDRPPGWLRDWKGDGIISRATTKRLAEELCAAQVPVVELTDRHGDFGLTHIWSDDLAIGRMAADHFLERSFKNFAYCGYSREAWSSKRMEGFCERLASKGFTVSTYDSPWEDLSASALESEESRLIQWALSLPKPVAVMCCNDMRGHQLLSACTTAELLVPEQMAVIGVDDDHLMCELCRPKLSSVIPNPESIGFQAAELLDLWMQGKSPDIKEILVPPMGIELRESSDIRAIEDPIVAAALRMIREDACDGICVQNVLDALNVSRSLLERRFHRLVKHSPQMEIRHVQVKRAMQLLKETEFPLLRIAKLSGFEHPEYLNVVFKRITGQTPGEYRRSFRQRPHA